jgi:hypothetical protein
MKNMRVVQHTHPSRHTNSLTADTKRTLRKFASMLQAMALASSVLPVPGGPYSSTPFGGLMPTRVNSSGFISGSSTLSRNSLR